MALPRRRRIKRAKVTHISLVPRGANRLPVIFKEDDDTFDIELLMKAAEDFQEKGELTAIVYAPEQRDSQGDIASAEVIKEAMYDAARDGIKIDMRHDGVTVAKSQAFVAESFIVQQGDPRFEGIKTYAGKTVDPTGAWGVVIKVDDPGLRQKYRDGEWNGVSMGGTALVENNKEDNTADRVIAALAKRMGLDLNSDDGDFDMTSDELAVALAKGNETMAKTILEGMAKLLKPEKSEAEVKAEKEAKEAKEATDKLEKAEAEKKRRAMPVPIFKGDITKADDLLQHQRNLALYELRKDVNFSDMDEVNEFITKMGEFEQAFGELTEADKAAMQGRGLGLLGLRKAAPSSVPLSSSSNDNLLGVFDNLSKEDIDLAKAGVEMAAWINDKSGFPAPAKTVAA